MLKNMKIGTRLAVGFAAVMILMVIIAVIAYINVTKLDEEVADLIGDKIVKTDMLGEMRNHVNTQARAVRNALLVSDPAARQRELTRVSETGEAITKIIEDMEKIVRSEAGKKLIASMKEKREILRADQKQVVDNINAGKKDEAVNLLVTKVRQSQSDYLKAINTTPTYKVL